MRLSVVGAGSIGLHLAASLARAGEDTGLVARRSEATDLLQQQGVQVVDTSSGSEWQAAIPRVRSITDLDAIGQDDALLACCREPDLPPLLRLLAAGSPQATIVCCQNGAQPEAHALPYASNVIGLVVRHTCMREATNRVRVRGVRRVVLGAAAARPLDDAGRRVLEQLKSALERSGFDVGVSTSLQEDRWLKLCANTLSPVNALVRRSEHATSEFAAVKIALLEEARTCLSAAGLDARSCDGRDPSLEQMIEKLRRGAAGGEAADALPVCNSVWTALHAGLPLEADQHLAEILDLGERFGVATPTHRRVLDLLLRCHRKGAGPESISASELRATPTRPPTGGRAR